MIYLEGWSYAPLIDCRKNVGSCTSSSPCILSDEAESAGELSADLDLLAARIGELGRSWASITTSLRCKLCGNPRQLIGRYLPAEENGCSGEMFGDPWWQFNNRDLLAPWSLAKLSLEAEARFDPTLGEQLYSETIGLILIESYRWTRY